MEAAVNGHKKVDEKEFIVLTELLMVQLLKLDGIEAEGEARIQRKNEVLKSLISHQICTYFLASIILIGISELFVQIILKLVLIFFLFALR